MALIAKWKTFYGKVHVEATAVIQARDGVKQTDLGNVVEGLLMEYTEGRKVGAAKKETRIMPKVWLEQSGKIQMVHLYLRQSI